MTRFIHGVFAVVLLGTSLVASVQAGCNANIPLTRPDARYVDHNDGTVSDSVTGLMWKQCPEGMTTTSRLCDSGSAARFTWQQALQRAAEVNSNATSGYSDWRLPDLKELKSLSELACYNPSINTSLFPSTPSRFFWSATPVASSTDNAWSVDFFYGGDRWGQKDDARHVRLVRTAK